MKKASPLTACKTCRPMIACGSVTFGDHALTLLSRRLVLLGTFFGSPIARAQFALRTLAPSAAVLDTVSALV